MVDRLSGLDPEHWLQGIHLVDPLSWVHPVDRFRWVDPFHWVSGLDRVSVFRGVFGERRLPAVGILPLVDPCVAGQ